MKTINQTLWEPPQLLLEFGELNQIQWVMGKEVSNGKYILSHGIINGDKIIPCNELDFNINSKFISNTKLKKLMSLYAKHELEPSIPMYFKNKFK